jgi:hypothetical protein
MSFDAHAFQVLKINLDIWFQIKELTLRPMVSTFLENTDFYKQWNKTGLRCN